MVVVTGVSLALAYSQDKKYAASATLLFRNPGFDASVSGQPFFAPSSDPAREADTNLRLVSLSVVADRTARQIGTGLTGDDISDRMSLSQEGQSSLVRITATDASPDLAARIANAFAREYITFRRAADRAKVQQALQLTRRSLSQLDPAGQSGQRGRLLQKRVDQLETLVALQTGNAELVQPAKPPSRPASPRPKRSAALGLLLGLLIGLAFAFFRERLDRRLSDPEELSELFGRPTLGIIAESRRLSRGAVRTLDPAEIEAFHLLRANLRYFNVDRAIRSVLVTSAEPGDGKSTVACNLAAAAGAAGARVLLIEADLRHPTVAPVLGISANVGLSSLLANDTPLAEVVQAVPATSSASSGRTIDVVPAGPLPPNPVDLLESERMKMLLQFAEETYDLVVLDSPPIAVVSDTIPLIRQVSGIIVVGRIGKTSRDSVVRLRDQLEHLDAPTLGVVVNAVPTAPGSYYGYGYGYAADPDRVDESVRHPTDRADVGERLTNGRDPHVDDAPEVVAAAKAGGSFFGRRRRRED